MGNDEGVEPLQEVTFAELFRAERLPSGHSFELMPDTVDTALRVAEVDDMLPWRKKAKEAAVVLKSVGGTDIQGKDGEGGFQFIEKMLDTDVVFVALAWTAQLNGLSIKMEEGVPCPSCAHPFMEVPFGDLKVYARPAPMDGSKPSMWEVEDVDDGNLPSTLSDGRLYASDPHWKAARSNVSEKSWSNSEVVAIYRSISCLFFAKNGSAQPRGVQPRTEGRKLKAKVCRDIIEVLDKHVPHFEPLVELTCSSCNQVSIVPFDQGL